MNFVFLSGFALIKNSLFDRRRRVAVPHRKVFTDDVTATNARPLVNPNALSITNI